MRILHVISSLGEGGVEKIARDLILSSLEIEHRVIVLLPGDRWRADLVNKGILVFDAFRSGEKWSLFYAVKIILKHINEFQPSVVTTWMYVSNVLLGLLRLFRLTSTPLVMVIHNGTLSIKHIKTRTLMVALLNSALSRLHNSKTIFCANSIFRYHADKLFYSTRNSLVIFNGYNSYLFNRQVKVENTIFTFGMVARFDPMKDHENLFIAVSKLKELTNQKFSLRLVGNGINAENYKLISLISKYNISDIVSLEGSTNDVSFFYNSLDAHVLSSFSEAMPNVVAESLLCGTPCISTKVGDVSEMIQDDRFLVERSNPDALARAMFDCMKFRSTDKVGWSNYQDECHSYISSHFSFSSMRDSYIDLWNSLTP